MTLFQSSIMRKAVFMCLVLTVGWAASPASAQKKKANDIYAFGYAFCLGDSVAYVSAIQKLEGATTEGKKSFLKNRNYYAVQLEQRLKESDGQHYTCALFYADSKKGIEKKYLALRRQFYKYKSNNPVKRLVEIPSNDFKFQPVVTE